VLKIKKPNVGLVDQLEEPRHVCFVDRENVHAAVMHPRGKRRF
jgi:hypothetical protein